MSEPATRASGFDHVEAWVFDLDNTLYPADCNLFAQIDRRMGEFIQNSFGIPLEEAQSLRESLLLRARHDARGARAAATARRPTLSSTMCMTSILSAVLPSPELAAALDALPGRKFIFTNGSRKHAEAVTARLGVSGHFADICDIHALEYIHPEADARSL